LKKILYIGNKLSSHGINLTTIDTLGASLEAEGYTLLYSSTKNNQVFRLLDMMTTTFSYAKKVDFILIDTYSTSSFWYAFFCSQISRILKTKYIPILHGGNLPTRLDKNPVLCKMLFKNAFANVAPSHYLMTAFESQGFLNCRYIPNSISIENYNFKNRTIFQPKLLWVRAFAEIYNPKMAIDVLKLIQEEYPNATLCMIGPDKDGSLQKMQEYASYLNLNVKFTGKLSKSEWIKMSEEYDIFINTTHADNMPVSVIEAMALGTPVISTNVGGIPFLIKDKQNGLLVSDNEVVAMSESIKKIIEDSVFANKMAINARKESENFDWEKIKFQWNTILNL
jgi:L-malate glycosyltransferase